MPLHPPPRVCAVSYLNTVPLVWGFLHGSQQGAAVLDFSVPSECARRVAAGSADLGIVPVVEMQRQRLGFIDGVGIACDGPVRSILLLSKVPPSSIRTLAADSGSQTSVVLARVLLARRFGASPAVTVMDPDPAAMLDSADAALLIGDAALRVDPDAVPHHVLDLGQEWRAMTGLPMVFAVWAGQRDRVAQLVDAGFEAAFRESLEFGLLEMNTIVGEESRRRAFSPALVRDYLTRRIVFRLGAREREGMSLFLRYAMEFEAQPVL